MDVPDIVRAEHAFPTTNIQVDRVGLCVVDAGPKDADRTFLFLHGNPTWSFLWRHIIRAVTDAGHRAVAVDHAGFGRSDKPEAPGYYSLARHVANLDAVARALDLNDLTLVIHDWGGPIGMGFAVGAPERIKRIVVTNTTAFAPRRDRPLSRWHAAMSSAPGQFVTRRFDLVGRTAMRFGVRRPMPSAVREAYAWPLRSKGGRVAAARFVEMVPDGPDHPEARTLRRYESGYDAFATTPIEVLWADKDPVFAPRMAERWQRPFPHATVRHAMPTAGHFWQEDDPAPVAAALLHGAAAVAQSPTS